VAELNYTVTLLFALRKFFITDVVHIICGKRDKRKFTDKMDLRTIRALPKPKKVWTTAHVRDAGLLRGAGRHEDRGGGHQRVIAVADFGARYWRNTPLLSSTTARTTPRSTSLPDQQRLSASTLYSSSWAAVSIPRTNPRTSTVDLKKPAKPTTDTGVRVASTSDVNELENTVNGSSEPSVPPDSHSTATSSLDDYVTKPPDKKAGQANDVTGATDSTTTMTSQHGGSRNDGVSVDDVRAQAAEAPSQHVANPSEMTMNDITSMLPGNSSENGQVRHRGATPEVMQVTSDGRSVEVVSGELAVNSKEAATNSYVSLPAAETMNDVIQVSGKVGISKNNGGMKNVIFQNTRDERANGSTSTPESVSVTLKRALDEIERGRSAPAGHGLMSSPPQSSSYDKNEFTARPRGVLLKSVNSNDQNSTVYWSSQSQLSAAVTNHYCLYMRLYSFANAGPVATCIRVL